MYSNLSWAIVVNPTSSEIGMAERASCCPKLSTLMMYCRNIEVAA